MTTADDLRAQASALRGRATALTASAGKIEAEADDIKQQATGLAGQADDLEQIADDLDTAPPPDPEPEPEPEPPPSGQILHGAFAGVPWPSDLPMEIEDVHISNSNGWGGQISSINGWPANKKLKSNIGFWPKNLCPVSASAANRSDYLRKAAAGDFDTQHRANAQAIKAKLGASGKFWLCLSHEANADATQPWGFTRSAQDLANYKAAYNRIGPIYKSVLGAQCVLVFCPGGWGLTVSTLQTWLPSSAEAIFLDVYDRWKGAPADCTPGGSANWAKNRYERRNKVAVDATFSVAKSKGLRAGYGEFGLAAVGEGGGGDNVYFIEQVMTAERASGVADADLYHNNNKPSADADHAIQLYPNAKAELKRQYALS